MNESPRTIDSDLREQIARAVAQDGTIVGVYRALAGTAIAFSALFALVVIGTRDLVPRMFDDFDADLPALNQIFVSPVFALAASVLCVATITKERVLKGKTLCAVWNTLVVILVLVLAVVYAAALVLPAIQIGERLS
jgi:hypothetical protein